MPPRELLALEQKSGTDGRTSTDRVVDQLLIASVATPLAGTLVKQLRRGGFYAAVVQRSGSFWGDGTATVMIGLERARLPGLLEEIRECCGTRPGYVPAEIRVRFEGELVAPMIETEMGGGTLCVLDVERFEQL